MGDLMRVPLEDLRAAANDLLQLSWDTQRVQRAVQQQWSRLDAGWQSYARAGVDAQFDETVREIERMAVMLEQLAQALAKTANTIVTADMTAAAFFNVEMPQPGSGTQSGNDVVVDSWGNLKDVVDLLLESGQVTFEQFKLWMNSIGIVDEYIIEIFYYQDDAVEILAISETWTQWIVKTPITVPSGWSAFGASFKDGLGLGASKLPLIGLVIDMGLTTWDYSDEGLFSNPEYYAALTTDALMFVGGAAVMAGVAALGLVGAPAILATIAVSVGWVCLSSWLEEPLTEFLTPVFEWAGNQLGAAWEGLQEAAGEVAEWASNAQDWTANAIDDAANWLATQASNWTANLVPSWGW
ncbi:MAG TPA: WXG100 family type VII secretion target [Anaerolineae bacterium]|nr:WXG100 family type VII secretion target [Anaerolineae bacterium]